jgi:hypothetical protein
MKVIKKFTAIRLNTQIVDDEVEIGLNYGHKFDSLQREYDTEQEAIDAAQQLRIIQPHMQESMDLFLNEKDNKRRPLIGNLIILRYPKISIFVHPNSWRDPNRHLKTDECDTSSGYRDQWWKDKVLNRCATNPQPTFLSDDDKNQMVQQLTALAEKLNDTTDYFCKLTLAWFDENPNDSLLPEMMHRCIRMSRYVLLLWYR